MRALFLAALSLADAAEPQSWAHKYDNLLQSTFIDFGYQPYTPANAQFLASHYAAVSIEKCSSRNDTEDVVWANARLLRAANPAVKTVFYWATDQQGLHCYKTYGTFMGRSDWWLRDDSGAIVNVSGTPLMDWANQEARDVRICFSAAPTPRCSAPRPLTPRSPASSLPPPCSGGSACPWAARAARWRPSLTACSRTARALAWVAPRCATGPARASAWGAATRSWPPSR